MKKILTMMLAAAIAISMAACSSDNAASSSASSASTADSASEADSAPEAETSEPADEVSAEDSSTADAAASGDVTMPDLDGFTKGEMGGATTYTTDDGSSIAVVSTPADSATLDSFKSKDEAVAAQFNQQLATTLGGAEVTGEFKTVEGKDVFAVDMEMQGMNYTIYMIAGSDTLYNVTGISMGTDIVKPMGEIVKSL